MARRSDNTRYDVFDMASDALVAVLKPLGLLALLYMLFFLAELLRP